MMYRSASKIIVATLWGLFFLSGCSFFKGESEESSGSKISVENKNAVVARVAKSKSKNLVKDKPLDLMIKVLEQADGIHREAWWVVTGDRKPLGKSPFGKIQRAMMSSENIKLSNKSLFQCDRYVVKRDILSPTGYPQKMSVFEQCSQKVAAKQIADVSVRSLGSMDILIYPEHLEDLLGLSATIINKRITCHIDSTEMALVTKIQCRDWAQERSKEHLIRLDTYEYQKDAPVIIKLRGKVYVNLTETRKIEVDVPTSGKITVKETELYAPKPDPKPTPTPTPKEAAKPAPKPVPKPAPPADPNQNPEGMEGDAIAETGTVPAVSEEEQNKKLPKGPLAAPGEEGSVEDAELIRQRIEALSPGAKQAAPATEEESGADGWPEGEAPQDSIQQEPQSEPTTGIEGGPIGR